MADKKQFPSECKNCKCALKVIDDYKEMVNQYRDLVKTLKERLGLKDE